MTEKTSIFSVCYHTHGKTKNLHEENFNAFWAVHLFQKEIYSPPTNNHITPIHPYLPLLTPTHPYSPLSNPYLTPI